MNVLFIGGSKDREFLEFPDGELPRHVKIPVPRPIRSTRGMSNVSVDDLSFETEVYRLEKFYFINRYVYLYIIGEMSPLDAFDRLLRSYALANLDTARPIA